MSALTPSTPIFQFRILRQNRWGLSENSLADWLAEAHNYPEDMDFTLTGKQIDQIAAYVVTLRSAGYVPDP